MKMLSLDIGRAVRLNAAQSTHPVIASLDIPLFAYGVKRESKVEKKKVEKNKTLSLFAAKPERA
ncbi:hypothetical protein [Mucilaginibacter sp. NFX135]|uniref:hypothetical protein n=1 Tax=Mucilaginibacter sp. NFX135 TaxID=3402687 RepID=UPI003AFA4501